MLLCEPSNAPVVYSGIKTEYTADGSITKESHPVFRHLLQGRTPREERLFTHLLCAGRTCCRAGHPTL